MTLSMKADIKQRWIAALESGEYEQGQGQLHERGYDIPIMGAARPDRFCCLGVLCKMAADDGATSVTSEGAPGVLVAYDGADTYLPESVVEWAGLRFEGDIVYTGSHSEEKRGILSNGTRADRYRDAVSLAQMNDEGEPFDVIAQTIRVCVVGV
jgi:hypothetical protein